MEQYRKVIKSARQSIACYLGTEPSRSQAHDQHSSLDLRVSSPFQVIHHIYSHEDSLAMRQVNFLPKRPRPKTHVRAKRRYERVYEERQMHSASPRKPATTSSDVTSHSRLSTAMSPERSESLQSYRKSRLMGLIDVCSQAAEGASQSLSPKKPPVRRQSHVALTANRVQQLDGSSDILEALYHLRRESELSLHRDAVRMKLDEVTNADPAAGQIKLMLVRNAVHRRNSRVPTMY